MYILNGLYMFLIECKFFFDIQLFPVNNCIPTAKYIIL